MPPDPINATFQLAIALLHVSQAVADIISRQTQRTPAEPLLPSMPMNETSIGTLWHISNIYLAQTQSYDKDVGHMVPHRSKLKIVSGEYMNLGILIENSYGV